MAHDVGCACWASPRCDEACRAACKPGSDLYVANSVRSALGAEGPDTLRSGSRDQGGQLKTGLGHWSSSFCADAPAVTGPWGQTVRMATEPCEPVSAIHSLDWVGKKLIAPLVRAVAKADQTPLTSVLAVVAGCMLYPRQLQQSPRCANSPVSTHMG